MRHRPRQRLPLLLILLAGAALRLYRLGADSLWYDETVSTYLAGSRLPELLRHTAGDIHPPGYYILLRGWLVLMGYPTGHADAARHRAGVLRSVLLALLRRPADRPGLRPGPTGGEPPGRTHRRAAGGAQPVQRLVQPGSADVHAGRGAGRDGGVRAAADRAGDRGQGSGHRSQESGVRGTGSMAGWWAVYAVAAAAGMYTLYYFIFLLIPLNLWVLWQIANSKWRMAGWQMADGRVKSQPPAAGRQNPASTPAAQTVQLPASSFQLPAWLLANLAAVLLYAPWIPVAYRQATNPPVPPWRTAPDLWHALRESWTALSLGQSAPSWLWPALLLTLGLYGLGLVALRRMANGRWQMADDDRPSSVVCRLSSILPTRLPSARSRSSCSFRW